MSDKPVLPPDLIYNPAWHIQDYQEVQRRFVIARLEEVQYAEASFLDHRLKPLIKGFFAAEFTDVVRAFPAYQPSKDPAAFIFHIGHCGSTLMSRVLGTTPRTLAIREPVTLTVLAKGLRKLEDTLSWYSKDEWNRLKDIVLMGFDRRFRPGQLPVVKATSITNSLAGSLLDSQADRKALLMHMPLESYLAGMLRYKDRFGDIRGQARIRLEEWQIVSGARNYRLSDLRAEELVAMSWMGSMAWFEKLEQEKMPQVMRVDFETFLDSPDSELARVAKFFGLESELETLQRGYQNVANSYSKDPKLPYSSAVRKQALDKSRMENAELIRKGIAFARSLAESTEAANGLENHFNN